MTLVEGIAQMKCILHTLVEYYLPIAARMMKTTKILHILGGGSTGDNFNQFSSNNGLTGTIEKNLELGNHVSSILGSVLRIANQHEKPDEGDKILHPWRCDEQKSRMRDLPQEPCTFC